jgi:hypothetical protein
MWDVEYIKFLSGFNDAIIISKENYLALWPKLQPATDSIALNYSYMALERLGNREQGKDYYCLR